MPKRTKKNSRYIKKGGIIIGAVPSEPIAPSTTGTSALMTWYNGAYNEAKKALDAASLAASSAASSVSSAASSATRALNPTPHPTGGRRRRRKGGSSAYISLTDLAATGSDISPSIPTAKPQVWVGGKTRKRSRHKHSKSCKTYKKSNRKKRAKTMKFPFSNSLKRLINY